VQKLKYLQTEEYSQLEQLQKMEQKIVKKITSKSVTFLVLGIACLIGVSVSINNISFVDDTQENNQNKEKQTGNEIEQKLVQINPSNPQPINPQSFLIVQEGDYLSEEAEKMAMNWFANVGLGLPVTVGGNTFGKLEVDGNLQDWSIRVGEHVINFDPENIQFLIAEGNGALIQNNYLVAFENFNKVLDIDPNNECIVK